MRADTSSNIDAVGFSSKHKSAKTHKSQKSNFVDKSKCSRCGKPNHLGEEQCPAKTATCRKCHKRRHFQTVCRSTKSVKTITNDEDTHDSADDELTYDWFIGTIEESNTLEAPTVTAGSDPWKITVSLNALPIEFHIDTGPDVTVITEKLYQKLKTSQLQKCPNL